MISAGVEGRLPYMTYPERWRGPPKQPPELFLRPAPKPMPPSTSRYNGVATNSNNNSNAYQPTNGTRLAPQPARPISKYPTSPSIPTPVNLAQTHINNNNNNNIIINNNKDDMVITSEDNSMVVTSPYNTYRLFHPHPHMPHFSYPLTNQLCQQPYLMRTNFPPTPLSPMEPYSPTTPPTSSTFLSPTFSPPSALSKPGPPGQAYVREKRTPPHSQPSPLLPQQQQQTQSPVVAFKVPSGKEGSLKHRILTRPEDCGSIRSGPLDLQKPPEGRKRLHAASTISSPPPRSPKKTINSTTATSTTAAAAAGNFAKGSLIQLHNGDLRRIEDMRTEDFVMSAERSPELRLAESTVVRIEEGQNGNATITLTYNQRRAQVDVESTVEHPYFVMGHGWASCNPERTLQCFGLKVHQLQVGDILISVTPRDKCSTSATSKAAATTIMTSATTTSMTAKQISVSLTKTHAPEPTISTQSQPINLHFTPSHPPQSMSPDSLAARKRRWSAPDQICDDEEQSHVSRRHRVE